MAIDWAMCSLAIGNVLCGKRLGNVKCGNRLGNANCGNRQYTVWLGLINAYCGNRLLGNLTWGNEADVRQIQKPGATIYAEPVVVKYIYENRFTNTIANLNI